MNSRAFVLPLLATSLVLTAGCANKSTVRPIDAPSSEQSTGVTLIAPPTQVGAVVVSDDIARACKIDFNHVDSAPRFDFDRSALLPSDRAILAQVATCVTTGPLRGRALELVGRADARGDVEYNMALGEHRAGSARECLAQLGVDKAKIAETSRGKLDATGTDEAGWARDRRVDILLQ
jgi:peptidoglycan-associated lipoprotein